MWSFALGLAFWSAFLLWMWVQVGRSLDAPFRREEEQNARVSADSDRAAPR
jgi:hypothetical protein